VTKSAKTGLITHERKFDFITQTQSLHYQISQPQIARIKGFAFSSCFIQALWRVLSPIHKYQEMVVLNIQGVLVCQWWLLHVPNFYTFYNNVLPSRSSSEEVVNS